MVAKQARVPRLIEGVDLTALPLSPLEGFVLSRIDGAATVRVLADLTNLPEDEVFTMAERLIELGAAEWARESVSLPRATSRPATKTPSREVEVPPFLRGPPARPAPGQSARVRMRPRRSSSVRGPTRPAGVYSSRPNEPDEVDTGRTSVFPAEPLTSHTGSSYPPGEIEEHLSPIDLGQPPPPELELGPEVTYELPPSPAKIDVALPPPPSAQSLASLTARGEQSGGTQPPGGETAVDSGEAPLEPAQAEAAAETESEAVAAPESEAAAAPESEAATETASAPESEVASGPASVGEAEPEAASTATESKSVSSPEPVSRAAKPFVVPKPFAASSKPAAQAEPEPDTELEAEAKPGPELANESERKPASQANPEPSQAREPEPELEGEPEAEPAAELQSEKEPAAEATPDSVPVPIAVPSSEAHADPAASDAASADSADPAQSAANEELDLDLERRKRINDLYYALDLLDHYQVLGVQRTAPRKEIRTAYFTLSKVFHPDTMFRKRLGPYKARMASIFQRLTEAYETLGKKKHRAAYDRYLGLQDQTRGVERDAALDTDEEERERLGKAAAQVEADIAAGRPPSSQSIPAQPDPPSQTAPASPEPKPSSPVAGAKPEPPPPQKTRAMSSAGKRRQRELMAKKLRSAARSSSGSRKPKKPKPSVTSSTKAGRKEVLRGLASSLRSTGAQTGGVSPIRRHLAAARRSEKAGNLSEAADHMRNAALVAPDDDGVRIESERIQQLLAVSLADAYEEQARYEQGQKKWAAAAVSWGKVVAGRPDDADASRLAAEALVEAGGDMHRAKALAQRATELDPQSVDNLRVLARVYIAVGLGLNARRVLQDATKLDPNDEMVENLLRDLGR